MGVVLCQVDRWQQLELFLQNNLFDYSAIENRWLFIQENTFHFQKFTNEPWELGFF